VPTPLGSLPTATVRSAMSPKLLSWSLTVSGLTVVLGGLVWGWQAQSWQWVLWIAVCCGLVWLQYRQLHRWYLPVDRLKKHVQRISVGDYDGLLGMHGYGSPWPELAEAFQSMREALRNRELRLRETSQRMESVLGSMIEGVLAVDRDEKIILLNREAKRMLAISQIDVIGRPLRELVRHPELIQAVAQAGEQQQPVFSEFTTARIPRRVLSLRVTPLPNDEADGLTVVLEDITELRQLENMRRDFAANVSHELKTPLTAIKAYAETLRLGAINDPHHCQHFIEQIEIQSERLHQLILDLLQLAQVESGKAGLDIQPVDLTEICRQGLEFFSEEASRRQVDLKLIEPDRSLIIQTDVEAIRTIVENLLSNAIRYTPAQGQVVVECSRARGWALLEVRDTGIGIAPEHHDRIFERFYRADKARSRDVGGTGLGLSIVKHLTQSLGGQVQLESELSRGSTFRVRIPDANSQSQPGPSSGEAAPPPIT